MEAFQQKWKKLSLKGKWMFEQDFIDFIELLNIHEVEYMIVGAHALSYHGRPRHTGDLDIWINPTSANAAKMVNVLKDFGFSSLGLEIADFLKQDFITQLGYPPLRIDLLNSISGVEFNHAYERKIIVEIDTLIVPFISIQDFILNKQATGRPKDIADIESLNQNGIDNTDNRN